MATPRQQLQGQIKTDITRAAEQLAIALRQLTVLMAEEDLVVVARAGRAAVAVQSAIRLLEYRGAETTPPE